MRRMTDCLRGSRVASALLLGTLLAACSAAPTRRAANEAPANRPRHVFVIILENEPFQVTFGEHSPAPYLAHELPKQGALLTQYFATGHYSLDNYISIISGQAPNPETQQDCHVFSEFRRSAPGFDADGQVRGTGCVYPADVKTLANQLQEAGYTWKGYMESMGSDPSREATACAHARIGEVDLTNKATAKDQYADKHNPFVYFHSIIDDAADCAAHVVNLDKLPADLQSVATTPNFSFITPDLCHDGHDAPCKNGEPGGLVSADKFLREWVPQILASPAFKQDGLLIITFDEGTDAAACCGETRPTGAPQPGQFGPGGGRIGAVVLSPWVKPGTVSNVDYNHYGLLRSIEDWFGLPHLGYAAQQGLHAFGPDVFNRDNHAQGTQP
ncbi:MAG TPA: alkaline phosphatase family protein, partial [Rhodanobacteraceae bacterium]|nr:alkaline phosphatase family protein [Rhodanobacteraceae bacterium]